MTDDLSGVSTQWKIVEQIKERHEDFVLSYILPYCQENTEYHIDKVDLKHALWLLTMERSGKLQYGERKTGKWAFSRDLRNRHCEHLYYCTCCEWDNDHSKTAFKYCPNCGAKMEVDDAGDNGDIPT